jgi:hypothetical protein
MIEPSHTTLEILVSHATFGDHQLGRNCVCKGHGVSFGVKHCLKNYVRATRGHKENKEHKSYVVSWSKLLCYQMQGFAQFESLPTNNDSLLLKYKYKYGVSSKILTSPMRSIIPAIQHQ